MMQERKTLGSTRQRLLVGSLVLLSLGLAPQALAARAQGRGHRAGAQRPGGPQHRG